MYKIFVGLLQGHDIPVMSSSKLGKRPHVQVSSFYELRQGSSEPHVGCDHYQWEYQVHNPLPQVRLIHGELHFHANLALDGVLGEVPPHLLGEWEHNIAHSSEDEDYEPVKMIEQSQVWRAILHKTTISILHKNDPEIYKIVNFSSPCAYKKLAQVCSVPAIGVWAVDCWQ